jgi:branched-chain amino acid transport system substrate-binding protein
VPLRRAALLLAGALLALPTLAQESVKIGYSGPLSGGAAQYGKNVLDGMKMAVDEINAAGLKVGGKPVSLEIVALDDKYMPSETAINEQRLVQEYKAPVVLCPHSGGGFAIQTSNEQQNVLLLSYTSVPQITARGNKLTFRIPPEFTGYIPAFIKYTMGRYGKKVGIADADHEYAKAWNAAFKPAWEAAGGSIVADNPMSYNRSTDFYSGVSKVLAAQPDVLFVGGASEPTGLVIKQARELGFKGGFILIDQAKMDEVAKVAGGYAALEGSIGVLPLNEDSSAQARGFVDRFHKLYPGRDPTYETSLNYTALWATAGAMALAGSTSDGAAIRAQLDKAIKALAPEHNPNGASGIDERGGSVTNALRVAVVEQGKVKEMPLASLSGK